MIRRIPTYLAISMVFFSVCGVGQDNTAQADMVYSYNVSGTFSDGGTISGQVAFDLFALPFSVASLNGAIATTAGTLPAPAFNQPGFTYNLVGDIGISSVFIGSCSHITCVSPPNTFVPGTEAVFVFGNLSAGPASQSFGFLEHYTLASSSTGSLAMSTVRLGSGTLSLTSIYNSTTGTMTQVPEPGTLGFMLMGMVVFGVWVGGQKRLKKIQSL